MCIRDSKGSYLKNFKNIQTAFASGWMSIRALRKRSGYDKGFSISDHADWDGILEVLLFLSNNVITSAESPTFK